MNEFTKRAELHLHTKMSKRDALISPADAVKIAKERGYSAVAITDHDGVIAFHEAMRASEKYGVKVIYGIEIRYKEDIKTDEEYHQTILVKNQTGLKNLYRLISKGLLERIPDECPIYQKSELEAFHEGLLFGSACGEGELFSALIANRSDEEIERIVKCYDYLEIMPICSNRYYINLGLLSCDEDIKNINRRIVMLGEKYNKPVVATCNAHFIDPEDEICHKIILNARDPESNYDRGLYLRTTQQMLEEFSYLGNQKAYEVVIESTNKIANTIEEVRPIPQDNYYPHFEGAEEELKTLCEERFKTYKAKSFEIARKRLDDELDIILKNKSATLFMIYRLINEKSESLGYHTRTRGLVGSSFVAYLLGITDIDPLKYDIPYESFFGCYGERKPNISLNISGYIKERIFEKIQEIFGEDHVFRPGSISTLHEKIAYGYVLKYLDDKSISMSNDEIARIIDKCVGVLLAYYQYPGGVMVIPKGYDVYDFTPIQQEDCNNVVTTHFNFYDLNDIILKLDVFGDDVPSRFKKLEELTGVKISDIPLDDPEVLKLFNRGEIYGLSEFEMSFVRDLLSIVKVQSVDDLLKILGLSHGTNTWNGNAEELIQNGVCKLSDTIAHREDIMIYLMKQGVEKETAFCIMENVRRGKGLTDEDIEKMVQHNVPEWYIESCKKIKYLFPKAHSVSYVISAIRLAWYKIHYPIEFYASTLTSRGYDSEKPFMMKGKYGVEEKIKKIQKKGEKANCKELSDFPTLCLMKECMSRGIEILPVNLKKSESEEYLIENGAIRMPVVAVSGISLRRAQNIISVRKKGMFTSVEDLQMRAKLSDEDIEILKRAGALEGI